MKRIIITLCALFLSFLNLPMAQADLVPASRLAELKAQYAQEKDPLARFHIQVQLARFFASNPLTPVNIKDAESTATNLLKTAELNKKDWAYSNATHHAYLVLGRIKLAHKDIKGAESYLVLAGNVQGSAALKSFGPNMTLAQELLAKGERAAVLQYLDACQKFWHTERAKLRIAAWKHAINKNRMPAFRDNLVY